MPYETDERLKSYLDTNQLAREQLCLAILSIDKRFTEVRPRHPRGGPDGGRDIEAVLRQQQRAVAAVGFVNQADDSPEKVKRVKQKFADDLTSALDIETEPEAFVFLTNVNLTVGDKEELIAQAAAQGLGFCEIFDRERLRIALDSPDGFSIRFQYLNIPLSPAEQSTFFARWGDDIQSVISSGFQKVQSTLDRVLFLQEFLQPLAALTVAFELDRAYKAADIGHFRAFCFLHLNEPKHNIFSILFGSTDQRDRLRTDMDAAKKDLRPGIIHGISGGQWEAPFEVEDDTPVEGVESTRYKLVGSSTAIGLEEVTFINIRYAKFALIRTGPRLALCDFNEAMFMPLLNAGLANKLKCIHVYANEYKLLEITKEHFIVDASPFDAELPIQFASSELADPWVRVRPTDGSAHSISFSEQTPRRFFTPRATENSLDRPRTR